MRMILVAVLACVATTAFPAGQSGAEKIVYDFCYADQYAWEIACEIGLSDPDGSNTIWLTGGAFPGAKQPAAAPDGSRVAFVHGGYAVADHIFVLNIAQGSFVQLTNGPANDAAPTWSPDGARIAFTSDRDGALELYVMNADGSGVARLTSNVGVAGAPAWAPDGARIAFDCRLEPNGDTDICAIQIDGSGFVRLTTDPGIDSGAAFAPAGGRIAFATNRYGGGFEIVIMEPGGAVNRVGAGTIGMQPAWSLDGTRLVYLNPDSITYTGKCYFGEGAHNADDFCLPVNNLFVVNIDGSGGYQFAPGANAQWMAPPASTGPSPYMGAPVALPGRIEAENYDRGGAGVAYADLTAGNSGGEYRTDDVDIERVEGSAQDYNVGWMVAGEWLQYTVNVATGGSYTVEAVVASSGGGGTFHLEVNGIARTGAISVPDTGGWQQWQTVTVPATLDAGLQRLRVVLDTNGSSGGVGNLNYLRLTTLSPPPPPPSTPPVASFTSSCSTLTCAFDGSASSATGGVITSYQWDFGDGSGGSGAAVSHTYAGSGTYTVALAVRDSLGQVSGQRRDVTVVAAAAHVGDIDQAAKKQSSLWTATVTIEIHGGSHAPLADATVRGSWTDGTTASCVTNGAGRCSLTLPGIARSQSSVGFTVSSVTHALGYAPDNNHDPDADSNGITIIVKRP